MKQINIFGEIDYIDENCEIKRCEICKKPNEKCDVCCTECAEIWIKLYLP